MEPLLIILVPGLLGGIVVALLVFRFRPSHETVRRRLEPPSPGLINMAHIPVDGIGGLGMVATAITVAIFVPQIRFAMVTALLSGTAVAAVLIALRRRSGPRSSDNDHPGAHGIFGIDGPLDRQGPARGRYSGRHEHGQRRVWARCPELHG